MALDATPGGENANSYVTETEAEDYFEMRSAAGLEWAKIADPESLLVTASQFLDTYILFKGQKTSATQAMEWPRTGVTYRDGTPVPDDIIPRQVKVAVMECAFYFNQNGDPYAASEFAGIREVKAGSLTMKVDSNYSSGDRPVSPVPAFVYKFLTGLYLAYGAPDQSLIVVTDE